MSEVVDVAIIGAGVIGLAVAAILSKEDREVYVLEKNDRFGKEVTSRSSGFTHCFYYACSGDQLKVRLTVRGRHLLRDFANRYDVPYLKTYLLFVAQTNADLDTLQTLFNRGQRQGAENLQILDKQELTKFEPNIGGVSALLCPELARFEPYHIMQYYMGVANSKGAQIAYNTEVIAIEKIADGYKVTVRNGSESTSFITRTVINCSGFGSEKIAHLAGIDIEKAGYRYQLYINAGLKDQGYKLRSAKSALLGDGSIHMVTGGKMPKGARYAKGLICDRQIDGTFKVGVGEVSMFSVVDPDTGRVVNKGKSYNRLENDSSYDSIIHKRTHEFGIISEEAEYDRKKRTYERVKWLLPFLELEDLGEPDVTYAPSPVVQYSRGNYSDWTINEESDKGLPGFVNVIGIDSPGFTAALSIAEYIGNLLSEWLD